MKRSYDAFHLNDDNKVIKDSFIVVAEEIPKSFKGKITDVGCAAGVFPASPMPPQLASKRQTTGHGRQPQTVTMVSQRPLGFPIIPTLTQQATGLRI